MLPSLELRICPIGREIMKALKINRCLTMLIFILSAGAWVSDTAFAQAARPGGGPGGRGGGPGMSGGHGGVRHAPPSGGHRYGGQGWRGGSRVGIYFGAPIGYHYRYNPYYGSRFYGSGFYGMPYYYPPVVPTYPVVQPAPVVYIERGDNQQEVVQEAQPDSYSQEEQGSWWYYCVDAKGYYPYVAQCPGGWLRVAPEPAPASSDQPATGKSVPDNLEKPSMP